MKRANRMQPVQKVVEANERAQAERLAASERRLSEAEHKLLDLEKYRSDYRAAYQDRVARGMSSASLRDYQLFLARLGEAVRQQTQFVQAARADRDRERSNWQHAARRAKAIDHVVEQWHAEERREVDRREQRDADERAQRAKPIVLE